MDQSPRQTISSTEVCSLRLLFGLKSYVRELAEDRLKSYFSLSISAVDEGRARDFQTSDLCLDCCV